MLGGGPCMDDHRVDIQHLTSFSNIADIMESEEYQTMPIVRKRVDLEVIPFEYI